MAGEKDMQVKSADRVLDLFELLSRSSRGVSHSDISERLGIPKSSLTPLLRNMLSRGFVVVRPDGRTYQLGPQLLRLVRAGRMAINLAGEAEIFLHHATREVAESSAFNQLKGDELEVVATVLGPHRLITHMKVGDLSPLYAASGGKAILAHMPEDFRRDYFKKVRFQSWTDATIVKRSDLERQLETIRRTGVAHSYGEWTPGIVGVGVVVMGSDNLPIGSVNFAIPTARYDEVLDRRAETALKRCAADMQRYFSELGEDRDPE
jgi:DNA-binding IclR family transcriptional regulator